MNKKFTSGYFPNGQNWHVLYGAPDKAGKMQAVIMQDGEEIATLEQHCTGEEINVLADNYMQEAEKGKE